MQLRFVPCLWLSLAMITIMAALAVFAWKRRSARGAPFLLLSIVLASIWIAAQAMEIASVQLSDKIIWANIQYFSIYLIPVTYLYTTLQFLKFNGWLRHRWLALMLLIVPLIVNILVWSNDVNGLFRQNIYLDTSGAFPVVGKTYGPLFWVFSAYNFAVSLLTLIVLVKGLMQKTHLYKAQAFALSLGLLLPLCSSALYVTRVIHHIVDITPMIISFSALVISWGIFRYRLFDIVKVAYSMVIHEMNTGLIIVDNEGAVLESNPAAMDMLCLEQQPLIGTKIHIFLGAFPQLIRLYEGKTNAIEEMVINNGEDTHYYEVSLKKLGSSNQTPIGWIIQIYDITKRKLEAVKIMHMASHDVLTGLINRGHFQSIFLEEMAYAQKTGSSFAIAYMDLDDFKMINDTYGHEAGDEYLRETGRRLSSVLRASDIVARYGGDEYVILFPSIQDNDELELISERIFSAFKKSFQYGSLTTQIKASIGFSVYPRDGVCLDTLVNKADRAMYLIKAAQKNGACIYQGD